MYWFLTIFASSPYKTTFRAKSLLREHSSSNSNVIIKLLLHRTEEASAQLHREYELLLRLQQHGIVPRVIDYQLDKGVIVLEDPGGDPGDQRLVRQLERMGTDTLTFVICFFFFCLWSSSHVLFLYIYYDLDIGTCLAHAIMLAKTINSLHGQQVPYIYLLLLPLCTNIYALKARAQ